MALLLKLTAEQSPAPFLGSAAQLGYTISQVDQQLTYERADAGDYQDLIDRFNTVKPQEYVLDYEII
jgi:hypothetical protein